MNIKSLILVCILLGFILGLTSSTKKEEKFSQSGQFKAPSMQEFVSNLVSLPENEKFVYKTKFLGIPIGTFTIINNGKIMFNGREVYSFELKVKALPFFLKFFKAKARYVSYMDAQDFVIIRHEEYIKAGTLLESAVDFDYKDHMATNTNFIDGNKTTVKIPDKLHDILSGGFYIRMMPLGLGDTVDLNIYADQKIYNYIGMLSSKTKISLPNYSNQDAYSIKPYLFLNGQQVKKISAEIFFTTTVPSKTMGVTLDTRFGNVNVVLVEGYNIL